MEALINIPVCRRTVVNRLLQHGYRARRLAIRPLLTPAHRRARLAWAQRHRQIQLGHWRHVVSTDESRFLLHKVDRRMRVRRLRGERFHEDCIQHGVAHGGGSVHVWAGIHFNGKTDLVVLQENVNQRTYRHTLATVCLPHARRVYGNNFLLQDDNAPAHRARAIEIFLQNEGVQRLPWPANSPDMNPIEHAWDQLDRAIRRLDPTPSNFQEIGDALVNEWNNWPVVNVNSLLDSMPDRIMALENSRGGATRY